MTAGYDLLVEAQSVETMDSLNSDEILEVFENEKDFEVISRLCERISFLIYQDSNFGLLPKSSSSEAILSSISRLCKSRVRSGFPVENETFVGRDARQNAANAQNYARERFLNATLLSNTSDELPALLVDSFSSSYLTTAAFSKKLIENDDRFLTTCLALLPLIETLPTDSKFHPVAVFLEGMHLLHYNCGVLFEWLNSELASSSLILRILKSCCDPRTRRFWMEYDPKQVDDIPTVVSWTEDSIPVGSSVVTLNVIEIVGDQEMAKTVSFRGQKVVSRSGSEPAAPQNKGSFGKWIKTVHELKDRLGRLLKAKLVPEKLSVILKWCDKFCDIHKEQ